MSSDGIVTKTHPDSGAAAPTASRPYAGRTRRTLLWGLVGITAAILVDLLARAYHRYVEPFPALVAAFDVGADLRMRLVDHGEPASLLPGSPVIGP